ncbi:MAG: YagK/YfjJ domain-containing protein [Paraglaciecola sp.]
MIDTTNNNRLDQIRSKLEMYKPPVHNKPYHPEILDKIIQFITSSLRYHPKATFYRADLRFPETCNPTSPQISDSPSYHVKNDSSVISRFQEALKWRINKHLSKHSKSHTIVHILWVRELSNQAGYHYHVIIALNANSFLRLGNYDNNASLANMVQTAWNSAMGISTEPPYFVYFSNTHYLDINQTDSKLMPQIRDTYNHFSYLAKVATKPLDDGLRNFGCSQLDNGCWSLMRQKIKRKGA